MTQQFGDSDDEDMPLNNDLGENTDDLAGDFPEQAGTISMTYCAICDSKKGAGDCNRWQCINSAALKWATSK